MRTTPWSTPKWPAHVPHTISGYEKDVCSIIDDSARIYPEMTYIIFNDGVRTFAQVKDTADRVANFLIAKGIGKGDRVAIFLPNLPHYPSVFFGILKTGAICVTCNPLHTPRELAQQLNDSGARALFCMDHPEFYNTTVSAIENSAVETVVICGIKSYLPKLKAFFGSIFGKIPKAETYMKGHLFFDDIIAAASNKPPIVEIDPVNDLALIIYTGGTTGVPKGAELTHANIMFSLLGLHQWMVLPNEESDVPEPLLSGNRHCFLGVLPWYHMFGLSVAMLWSCYISAKLICIPNPRAGDPPFTDVLKAVEKYKTTALAGVPTIYTAFTNHPLLDRYDLSSLKICGAGGAPLPVEVAKRFEAKTGGIIFEAYGLSETSPLVTANPSNIEQRKFGSVGFPMPNTDVKIVDMDNGVSEMQNGEDGEIAINGPQVTRGYWNKPEATKEVYREIGGETYFLTGDIGHIDDEGYVVITDRKKDMIIISGFNCYPREVEEVLFEHPKVENAAVIGVPDEKSGERVKAFIQLIKGETATQEEIIAFCEDKLAAYKRPKFIEFRDELPTSIVGKILRRVLRDEEEGKISY